VSPFIFAAVMVGLVAVVVVSRRQERRARRRDQAAGFRSTDRTAAPATTVQLRTEVHAEVQSLLSQRRKIEAIRLVREHTGLGLKEAKDYVERAQGGNPSP